jgi:hypothetical protein
MQIHCYIRETRSITVVVQGILTLVYSLKVVMRSQMVAQGFKDCGQYPINFDKVMSKCYIDIEQADLDVMKAATSENAEFFLQHGHLTEEQMDKTNIMKVDFGKARNEKPISNTRASIVTHHETWKRYLAQQTF